MADVNTGLSEADSALDTLPGTSLFNRRSLGDSKNQEIELTDEANHLIDILTRSETPIQERVQIGARLQKEIVPILLKEMLASRPSVDRSVVAARFGISIRDIIKGFTELRDLENKDEVDLNHPKIQTAFGWFIEIFEQSLISEGVDPLSRKGIFMTLQASLSGWEGKANKSLKGVSAKALNAVGNPFLNAIENADFEISSGIKAPRPTAAGFSELEPDTPDEG